LSVTGDPGSPLSGTTYSGRAHDLSRFVDDPADQAVAEIVRQAMSFSIEDRAALRARLSADDCYTLLTFADRRSASGIRDGALEAALEAVHALTLITASKIDCRDLSVDFPLYAVRRLGGNVTEALASAAASSESGTRGSFTARAGRAEGLTLKDCDLLEVNSRYGLGFIEAWAEPYAPESDLAGMAIRIADDIDVAQRYEVDGLHLSSLPEVWFGRPANATRDIPVNGCVRVSATLKNGSRWGQGLLLFLAEVDRATAASNLVVRAEAASTLDRPQTAGSEGRLFLIVIGGSSTRGESSLETQGSLRLQRDALLRDLHS
jgi:hypothetical protein